jgi:hypothetical protein
MEYTVDVGGTEPCIRSLPLAGRPVSRCRDLPAAVGGLDARAAWSIAASGDGVTAVAANGPLGVAFVLRGEGDPVAVDLAGRWPGPPPLAVASDSEAYVQTDAGLERLDLAAGSAAPAGPAPPGLALLVAAPDGVLAVDAVGAVLARVG